MDAETRRVIEQEMRKWGRVILSGSAGTNTMISESIDNLYPGMATVPDRPLMHPYGFASRAPRGTIQVTGRQGEHFGNMMVLGHRAADRPEVAVGESVMYSSDGHKITVKNGSVEILHTSGYTMVLSGNAIVVGKGGTTETVVVGETMVSFLTTFCNAVIAHTHTGNLGFPTSPPNNAGAMTAALEASITNNKVLCKDGGRF